jgi:hypothetical protein
MMEFNKAYNRAEFLEFLKGSFLPEKDFTKEETILNFPGKRFGIVYAGAFCFLPALATAL